MATPWASRRGRESVPRGPPAPLAPVTRAAPAASSIPGGGGTRRAGSALGLSHNFRRIGRQRTFSFYFALGVQVRSSGSSPGAFAAPPRLRTCVLPGASWAPGAGPEDRATRRGALGGPSLPSRSDRRQKTLPLTSHHLGKARPLGSESIGC